MRRLPSISVRRQKIHSSNRIKYIRGHKDYHWRRWVGHWYPVGLLYKYFWWYSSALHHTPAGSMTVAIFCPFGSKWSFWTRAVTSLAISSCSGVWVKMPERYSKAILEYVTSIKACHGGTKWALTCADVTALTIQSRRVMGAIKVFYEWQTFIAFIN